MNTQTLTRFESLSRVIAVCTSAAAALMFALAFTTERHFGYELGRFIAGKEQEPGLAVYLGIVSAVLTGYLLASRKRFAKSGGILVIVSVAAMYAWCQIGLNITLAPILLVIAGPAVFHLSAVVMHQAGLRRQFALEAEEPAEYETAPAEGEHVERALAAGVA